MFNVCPPEYSLQSDLQCRKQKTRLLYIMSANSSHCSVDHDLDHYLFPFVYITVIVISVPANCAALFIACLHIKKKNELGVYLFHLSLADLLFTLILPLLVDYVLNHDNWRFSSFLCTLSVFLMHTNFYASASFLTCISLDRYLAVVHPMNYHLLRTRKAALFICIVVWSLEVSANGIILRYEQILKDNENHTLCYDVFPMEPLEAYFNMFRACVGYLMPLLIMGFCYQRIDAAVKQNQATSTDAKRKIRKLLISILATFFLCFTPYHVLLLMRSIWEPGNCRFATWIFKPYKTALAIATLNCLADPILYCFVSETSQRQFAALVKCCGQKDQISAKQDLEMSPVSNKKTDETTPTLKEDT